VRFAPAKSASLPQIFPESTAAFFQFSAARRASRGDPASIGAVLPSMAEM
jgi:hypothetical protein